VIALVYLAVIGCVTLAESLNSWGLRLLALPIIGALQNHLQILQHEGAHGMIHPKRKWNDFITDLFCSLPFFGLVRHYRYFHFMHHRYLLDPRQDPEVPFYLEQGYDFKTLTKRQLIRLGLLDLCGYHYFQFFGGYQLYLVRETRAGRLAPLSHAEWRALGATLLAGLIVWTLPHGSFYLAFYWLLPQFTFMFFFLKLQGYGEHTERHGDVVECTHNHRLNWITRFFIYPLNSELHQAHHLNPGLPWYRLRKHARYTTENYFFGGNSVVAGLTRKASSKHRDRETS